MGNFRILSQSKKQENSALYYRTRKNGISVEVCTGIIVNHKLFSNPTKWAAFLTSADGRPISEAMANAKDFIEAEIQRRQESGEPITSKILSEHIKKISNEIELQRQEAILAEEQKRNRANIISFYDEVIEEMLTTNQNE